MTEGVVESRLKKEIYSANIDENNKANIYFQIPKIFLKTAMWSFSP